MLTLILAFLIVASLGVSTADVIYGGYGLCSVEGNYTGVDPIYTQPRNPNFGTFSATAFTWSSNGPVTRTYTTANDLRVTIASNGTDKIAGIVGYFTNSTQSSPLVGGWWLPTMDETYNSTDECRFEHRFNGGGCEPDVYCTRSGFSIFSYANDQTASSQSEVSLLWSFTDLELRNYMQTQQNASTLFSVMLRWAYPYSGTLYWTLNSHKANQGDAFITTAEHVKAGLLGSGSEAYRSGNITFGDESVYNFTLQDLAPHTHWQVYYFADIINPPTISLQAYVLTGVIGNTSSQQLYRTVAGDPDNLVLRPATIPLPTRLNLVEFDTGVAYTVGPAMFLIALCLWLSSSQMFL
jgi:hypothetical protein